MSRLLDDDQDDLPDRERELTLSTGAILAIFLGLVLLCAVFFGFGYNLGRKSTAVPNAPLPAATSDTEPAGTGKSSFDNFKPSPSSPPASSSTASMSKTAPPAVATTAQGNSTETQPCSCARSHSANAGRYAACHSNFSESIDSAACFATTRAGDRCRRSLCRADRCHLGNPQGRCRPAGERVAQQGLPSLRTD